MSRPRLLVVTTVHQPDDARIRAKLIETLTQDWDVTYATRVPGPADMSNLHWRPLAGGRFSRWLAASRLILAKRWDLVALHDPELLPAAILRAGLKRPTLFDLHENLPAQIRTKDWLPRPLRKPIAIVAGMILRVAERVMSVTLAEAGYQPLFRRRHPVIANHPVEMPAPVPPADPPFLAYLGDVTESRGAFLAIEAAAGAGQRLLMVGRVAPPELGPRLVAAAERAGVEIELAGPLPHREALEAIAPASAGLSPLTDISNYRHSLPTKVLEYLALGLAVLASDLAGTHEVAGDRPGMVYVTPGDPVAWRSAGADLAADTAIRDAAQTVAAQVRATYTWPSDEVLRVYAAAARR